jgi:hypothetical protein
MKEMREDGNWAEQEFSEIELGDVRRKKRLIELAGQRARKPNGSISESCGSKAATKAAYRLLDNEDVEADRILESHTSSAIQRARGKTVLLAIQDTTLLDYTRHRATQGLGYLHDLMHQGMIVHSTLLVSPERIAYGLIQQQVWVRPVEDYRKRHKRYQRLTAEKESQKWLTSLQAAAQVQKQLNDSLVVSIGDSEADVYDLFQRANELKQALLVRASRNRRVMDAEKLVWQRLENQPEAGQVKIQVPRRAGKRGREVTLSIRFCSLILRPPKNRLQSGLSNLPIWGVLAREINPPSDEKGIEWLLLTTTPVESLSDARERMQWYTGRWVIEMYHKVLKSGCRVEERQFEDFENLKRYLALDSVVAWRILYLTFLNRETPDLPATSFLETHEWQALYCFVHQTNRPPNLPPSLREATRWIAQLGGFLGRKQDGSPGTLSLWRGMQRLADIADAWLAFHPDNCG